MEYLDKCEICGIKMDSRSRNIHLSTHGMTFEEYIVKVVYNGIKPICECGCGTETVFKRTFKDGGWFPKFTKNHFPRKPHTEEAKEKIKTTYKKNMQELYGVDNMFQLESIKDKIKATNLEKYGSENVMLNDNIKKKVKSTKKEKYGDENYQNMDKIKATNREKYGSDYYMGTQQFLDATKETIQRIYGVDNIAKTKLSKESFKKTSLENHGVEHPMKNKEVAEKCLMNLQENNLKNHGVKSVLGLGWVIDKTKLTSIKRYGVEYPSQNIDIQKKAVETNKERYGVDYPMSTDSFKETVKATNQKKYGVDWFVQIKDFKKLYNSKHSKDELRVCKLLNGESAFMFKGKEYDIKLGNNIYEIDGDYFHNKDLKNLTIYKLTSTVNDHRKIKDISESEYNLYKIFISNLPKEISEETLQANSYIPNFELKYEDVIINKEYLKEVIERNGKEYLEKYLPVFYNFVKEFSPTFPYHKSGENKALIMATIRDYKKYDQVYQRENKTFLNHSFSIGNMYLKAMFHSYWKSAYRGNKSPVEMWECEKDMLKIIKYRIGVNDSNEVYDFSLKNLVKGISAIRGTISFFKPLVAASIYKEFLGMKNTSPRVFDPCCGFGGRLLGFKSLYPNGTYIGCEPNVETYNELLELSSDMENVTIYNCKVEDLELNSYDFDLTFTSIPYFDLETYSNVMEYESLEVWKETFIKSLYRFGNLLINAPKDLENVFEGVQDKYFLRNTVSKHLNKKDDEKFELILKFF